MGELQKRESDWKSRFRKQLLKDQCNFTQHWAVN